MISSFLERFAWEQGKVCVPICFGVPSGFDRVVFRGSGCSRAGKETEHPGYLWWYRMWARRISVHTAWG